MFIVEGGRTEFSLLKKIFCGILDYEYIEKRRNRPNYFQSNKNKNSRVAVINTEESHISFVEDENNYLDNIFETLIIDYNFPVDNTAIYYLFDRDPKSNTDVELIKKLIYKLRDPYENGDLRGGVLLLSYPSVESFVISNFLTDSYDNDFALGSEAKIFISNNNHIQINNIHEDSIKNAVVELKNYLENEEIDLDIDNFSRANIQIFNKQENYYLKKSTYKTLSLLSIAFLQLGIISFE
ncbi:hypothetical protein [Iocasia frigidifontis]|uniref:hypothetical protein n=1 Tax=Iocasia fonsfrigidae TaxID=2682810 RepID=UPI001E4B0027|nr:hypothetical protein [Iocasia fonsfrigidae]